MTSATSIEFVVPLVEDNLIVRACLPLFRTGCSLTRAEESIVDLVHDVTVS